MRYGRRVSMLSALPLLFAILCALISGWAAANPVSAPPPWFTESIDLVLPNFPINGLLLFGLYLGATLMGWRPDRMGILRYLVVSSVSVGIITFSGALIDTVAFLEDDLVVYLAAAALIACIVVGVSFRYLRMPIRYSIVAGTAFFIINIAAWMFIDGWFSYVEEPSSMSPALWIFFLTLLALLALTYHDRRRSQSQAQPGIGRHVFAREGGIMASLRAEWPLIEAWLFSILLLAAVVYVSFYPIFRWPEGY